MAEYLRNISGLGTSARYIVNPIVDMQGAGERSESADILPTRTLHGPSHVFSEAFDFRVRRSLPIYNQCICDPVTHMREALCS